MSGLSTEVEPVCIQLAPKVVINQLVNGILISRVSAVLDPLDLRTFDYRWMHFKACSKDPSVIANLTENLHAFSGPKVSVLFP